ncbi:MAG: response regulator [Polyangiaceae bacterium]|nr:response regulator [Polyangiaceae bacterium]
MARMIPGEPTMLDEGRVDILAVDDNADNLVALEAILDQPGQRILRARSGREALRHVLGHELAVILLDINMPGMDGFETAQLIRQHRNARHTPIIFMTARGDELHLQRSYSLGAVDYIMTPVVPEVLRTKVGVFVELFRKAAEVRRQAAALQRRAAQLHLLSAASIAINSALSLDAMLRAITDAARDILQTHQAVTVLTLDLPGERPRAVTSVSDRISRPPRQRDSHPDGWLTADPARQRDSHPDGWLTADPARPPRRSRLTAPLTEGDGRMMGLIELSDKIEGDFSDDDEALLVQLAQLGSIAIQNCVNAEAREANRLKDEFLATLSHELRTPLNAILGWTRILRAGPADPARLARGLEVIERNVRAQAQMIEDLLDVSRITSGKMRLSPRPLELGPVVEAVLETLRPAAEAKEISLTGIIDGGAGLVNADPERMQQALSNLIGNAIKFTPRGGRVDVHVTRANSEPPPDVHVRVSDNGEGISPEFLPLVFERFRQADSTVRRAQGGLGIGLALVRHIVELHGGSVRAESPGPGRGSTFTLRLPVTARAPVAVVPGASAALAPPGEGRAELQGLRVLVVEDDPDARELVAEVLLQHRAEVVAVGSAQAALEVLSSARPHVLVSDVAMPGGDGYELIRHIRQRAPEDGGGVPALALTARALAEDHAHALAAGFQMHAAKPIDPAELVTAVARLGCASAGVPTGG